MHWVESVDIGSGFDAANPPPSFAPGTGPCDGQSAAASGSGLDPAAASAASCSAQPPPGFGTRFGEEYPHFPNGHRRLGLTPQVLVERGTATTALALPVAIGLSTGFVKIPEMRCVV